MKATSIIPRNGSFPTIILCFLFVKLAPCPVIHLIFVVDMFNSPLVRRRSVSFVCLLFCVAYCLRRLLLPRNFNFKSVYSKRLQLSSFSGVIIIK
jgi:hypothetical protein